MTSRPASASARPGPAAGQQVDPPPRPARALARSTGGLACPKRSAAPAGWGRSHPYLLTFLGCSASERFPPVGWEPSEAGPTTARRGWWASVSLEPPCGRMPSSSSIRIKPWPCLLRVGGGGGPGLAGRGHRDDGDRRVGSDLRAGCSRRASSLGSRFVWGRPGRSRGGRPPGRGRCRSRGGRRTGFRRPEQ